MVLDGPGSAVKVVRDGAAALIENESYGATSEINGKTARGTFAAPLAVLSGWALSAVGGMGYDGAAWSGAQASVWMRAAEDWSAAAHGSDILFFTTPIGSTALTPRWQIMAAGNFSPIAADIYDIGTQALPIRTIYGGYGIFKNYVQAVSFRGEAYGGFASHIGYSAGGTAAAPTVTLAETPLSVYQGVGRTPSGWGQAGAAMVVQSAELHTDNAQGTYLYFSTTMTGGNTIAPKWKINPYGSFMPWNSGVYDIGNTNAQVRVAYLSDRLDINQAQNAGPPGIDGNTLIKLNSNFTSRIEANASGQGFGSFVGRSSRGTLNGMTATQSGDWIAAFSAQGFGPVMGPADAAVMVVVATENFTALGKGTSFVFGTTPVGSTSISWQWKIDSDGAFAPYGATDTIDVGRSNQRPRYVYTKALFAGTSNGMFFGDDGGTASIVFSPGPTGFYSNMTSGALTYYAKNAAVFVMDGGGNAQFGGALIATQLSAKGPSWGYITLYPAPGRSGYVGFHLTDTTRTGYIGYSDPAAKTNWISADPGYIWQFGGEKNPFDKDGYEINAGKGAVLARAFYGDLF
jgi:hypothetical protein